MFYSVKITEMHTWSVQFHLISWGEGVRFGYFQAIYTPMFIPYIRMYLLGKIFRSLVFYLIFVPIGKKNIPTT